MAANLHYMLSAATVQMRLPATHHSRHHRTGCVAAARVCCRTATTAALTIHTQRQQVHVFTPPLPPLYRHHRTPSTSTTFAAPPTSTPVTAAVVTA